MRTGQTQELKPPQSCQHQAHLLLLFRIGLKCVLHPRFTVRASQVVFAMLAEPYTLHACSTRTVSDCAASLYSHDNHSQMRSVCFRSAVSLAIPSKLVYGMNSMKCIPVSPEHFFVHYNSLTSHYSALMKHHYTHHKNIIMPLGHAIMDHYTGPLF